MHWAEAYVGRPWDPREDHCWAFCRRVWRERFGLEVPEMPVDAENTRAVLAAFSAGAERAAWQPVAHGEEGDAVLMAQGRRPCHVGIWIAPAAVLHSVAGSGAVCTPLARLGTMGYRIAGLYRRAA